MSEKELTAQDLIDFFGAMGCALTATEKKDGVCKYVFIEPKEISNFVSAQDETIKSLEADIEDYYERDRDHIEMIKFLETNEKELKTENAKLRKEVSALNNQILGGLKEQFADYAKMLLDIGIEDFIRQIKKDLEPLLYMATVGDEDCRNFVLQKFNSILLEENYKERVNDSLRRIIGV